MSGKADEIEVIRGPYPFDGKVVLYVDAAGFWRWRAVARNGRIVADSGEGYHEKRKALHGLNVAMSVTLSAVETLRRRGR